MQVCRLRTDKGHVVVPQIVRILADQFAFLTVNRHAISVLLAVSGEVHAALHEGRCAGAKGVDVGDVVPDAAGGLVEIELELGDGTLDLGWVVEEFDGNGRVVSHGKAFGGDYIGLAVPSLTVLEARDVIVDWPCAVVDHGRTTDAGLRHSCSGEGHFDGGGVGVWDRVWRIGMKFERDSECWKRYIVVGLCEDLESQETRDIYTHSARV